MNERMNEWMNAIVRLPDGVETFHRNVSTNLLVGFNGSLNKRLPHLIRNPNFV